MFIDTVFEKLARHPKRIVFPEGKDPRIIEAASEYIRHKLGPAILLGNKDEVQAVAAQWGINASRIKVINPETADDLSGFIDLLLRLPKFKEMDREDARKMLVNPNYFAAMMLQYGQADGLVTGAQTSSAQILRPLFSVVKPLEGFSTISSCMVMQLHQTTYGDNGLFFMADTGIIPEPTFEQLASIAVETALAYRQSTGNKPFVAMLSYSTRGSIQTKQTEKIVAATALAKKMAQDRLIDIEIDGELQVDAALDAVVGKSKAPDSPVAGKANVLVFPDLNSGNIAAKLVQRLTGCEAYGHLLMGISKPAADISRGATVKDILGIAAIIGLRAITYRSLYPDQGVPKRYYAST